MRGGDDLFCPRRPIAGALPAPVVVFVVPVSSFGRDRPWPGGRSGAGRVAPGPARFAIRPA